MQTVYIRRYEKRRLKQCACFVIKCKFASPLHPCQVEHVRREMWGRAWGRGSNEACAKWLRVNIVPTSSEKLPVMRKDHRNLPKWGNKGGTIEAGYPLNAPSVWILNVSHEFKPLTVADYTRKDAQSSLSSTNLPSPFLLHSLHSFLFFSTSGSLRQPNVS